MGLEELISSAVDVNENNLRYLNSEEDTGIENPIDPSEGPEDDRSPSERLLGVTFENINKNIYSFPSNMDISSEEYFSKIYYWPQGEIVTVTTDARKANEIFTTITSNRTMYVNGVMVEGLTKTIQYKDDEFIKTVYGTLG